MRGLFETVMVGDPVKRRMAALIPRSEWPEIASRSLPIDARFRPSLAA